MIGGGDGGETSADFAGRADVGLFGDAGDADVAVGITYNQVQKYW